MTDLLARVATVHGGKGRSSSVALAAALWFCGFAGLSPPAHGKPGYSVHPASNYRAFSVRASNYKINGFVSKQGVTTIEVVENLGRRWITYSKKVSLSRSGRIRADLEQVVYLDLRWIPNGPVRRSTEPQGDCHGKPALVQHGEFVGSFVFHGEPGMHRLRRLRLRGLQVRSFREVCRGPDAGPQPALEREVSLRARSVEWPQEVSFRAAVHDGFGGPIEEFEALVQESRGNMLVERGILAGGDSSPGQFIADPAAGRAEVHPPSPFSGQASFDAVEAADERWMGDLAAEFIGIGNVSLAGKGFSATLTRRS